MRLLVCLAVALLAFAPLLGCEEKVSEANFDKIQVGMSLEKVEDMLGEGTREDVGGASISAAGILSGTREGPVRTYSWKEGERQIIVEVRDGKVITKRKLGF